MCYASIVAEYEALVNGLRIAIELGVRRLDARGDSQLVIDQVMKNSHCHAWKTSSTGSISTTSPDDTTRLRTSWLR